MERNMERCGNEHIGGPLIPPRTPNGVRFSRTHQPPVARYASLTGAKFLHASGVCSSDASVLSVQGSGS